MTLHVPTRAASNGTAPSPTDRLGASSAVAAPAASSSCAVAAAVWTPLVVPATRRKANKDATPAWMDALLRNECIRDGARAIVTQTLPAELAAAAAAATSAAAADLPPLVYAHQREIAIVSPGVVQYVGSGDATTCVIVAFRCARTRRTAVAHLDGADPGQLWGSARPAVAAKSKPTRATVIPVAAAAAGQRCTSVLGLLNAFSAEDIADGIDIHVVGGFQTRRTTREEDAAAAAAAMVTEEKEGDAAEEEDEDAHEMDQSDGLVQVRDLLLLLHSYASGALGRPCEMRLQTLCVGPLNTAWGPEDMPVAAATPATGLAVAAQSGANTATAAAAPLSFPRPLLTSLFLHVPSGAALGHMPYGRGDRGPDMVLRTLRGGVGPPEELSHVYREEQDRFEIRAFRHENMHAPSLRALLSLPDAQFLQKSSTSPLVEPPFFVPDMRDCYEHLAKRPRWQMSFPEGEKEVHWFERSALSNQWLPGKE